jgi:hypothetical protein
MGWEHTIELHQPANVGIRVSALLKISLMAIYSYVAASYIKVLYSVSSWITFLCSILVKRILSKEECTIPIIELFVNYNSNPAIWVTRGHEPIVCNNAMVVFSLGFICWVGHSVSRTKLCGGNIQQMKQQRSKRLCEKHKVSRRLRW